MEAAAIPPGHPGVFVEELRAPVRVISAAATSTAAFVGVIGPDFFGTLMPVRSLAEFRDLVFLQDVSEAMAGSIELFFQNGGRKALVVCVEELAGPEALDLLEHANFNLLCLPVTSGAPAIPMALHEAALILCQRKRALYLADPPAAWSEGGNVVAAALSASPGFLTGAANAALYLPRIEADAISGRGRLQGFPACGAVAGIIARNDSSRGVWKAPAGPEAVLNGVSLPGRPLSVSDFADLSGLGLNGLRVLPDGKLAVWGARTRAGADVYASEWRYVPVRRLAMMIESSVERGLQWTVFEPNGAMLWARIRATIEDFLRGLWKQGAFRGSTPGEAFFVTCDRSTMSVDDIEAGKIIISLGFAALRPAEFLILRIFAKAA